MMVLSNQSFLQKSLGFVLMALAALTAGCSFQSNSAKTGTVNESGVALRNINLAEKEQDVNQFLNLFKSYYAPYQYKEQKIGISMDKLAAELKADAMSATTDEEFAAAIMKYGAKLRDGHVQIVIPNTNSKVAKYTIPMLLDMVEGKALVVDISKALSDMTDINVGDEVTSIDGLTPEQITNELMKYRRRGTLVSDLQMIYMATSRPSYMTSLTPKSGQATVAVQKADGSTFTVEIPWEVKKYVPGADKVVSAIDQATGSLSSGLSSRLNMSVPFAHEYNEVTGNIGKMGAVEPFYWSAKLKNKLQFVNVAASAEARARFGLKPEQVPPIFAGLYKHKGKTVLLMRNATYWPEDYPTSAYMKAYQALMSEYQNFADVLVLDQTHNPGGSYCAEFYELFGKAGDAQSVQQMRADRRWINELLITTPNELGKDTPAAQASITYGQVIEKAYDRGDFLSPALPLFANYQRVQDTTYKWTKPMLVVIDEMAGSCGDMFPMLVKANKRAKLFGQQTMGLGGNVEEVGVLNNSQILVKMTRGLFHTFREDGQYQNADYVENNGVTPDYLYTHTVKDMRAGYLDYVRSFSDKAVEQIP